MSGLRIDDILCDEGMVQLSHFLMVLSKLCLAGTDPTFLRRSSIVITAIFLFRLFEHLPSDPEGLQQAVRELCGSSLGP